jgi:hypothetical protein
VRAVVGFEDKEIGDTRVDSTMSGVDGVMVEAEW